MKKMRKIKSIKSRTLSFESDGRSEFKISLHCKELEAMDEPEYLKVKLGSDYSGKAKAISRVMQGEKMMH